MTVNPIDKLVLEWAYRCKKGYPDINNLEDKKVLEEIMQEWGLTNEDKRSKQPKTVKEPTSHSNYVESILRKAGVSDDVIQKVQNSDHYQAADTVDSFIRNLDTYLKVFYNDLHRYKVPRGGYGELIPFVAIKNARLGGANEKDITADKIVEIKDFSSGNELSLASGGSVLGSDFLENLETFLKGIKQFQDYPKLEELYRGLTSLNSIRRQYLQNLEAVLKDFPINADSIDKSFEEIKIGGKKYLVDKAKKHSLEFDKDGNLITTADGPREATVQEVALRKLLRHPWVTGTQTPFKDLEKVKEKGITGIDYFLLFLKGGGAVVLDMSKQQDRDKLKIYRVSNGFLTLTYDPGTRE